MPVDEVRAHLRRLFKNEPVICSLVYGRHGSSVPATKDGKPPTAFDLPKAVADIFFMEVVPVPPTRFRPASKMGEMLFENPQNTLLQKVLTASSQIASINERLVESHDQEKQVEEDLEALSKEEKVRLYTQLLEAIYQLQHEVNSFLDSSKNPTVMRGGALPPNGVKQVLEKKDGLFRKHMMVSGTVLLRSIYLPLTAPASTGQASKFCRTFRHFPGHQHRDQRDWGAPRLCSQADLPGASDAAQCAPYEAAGH
jgi:DNA-directed RNA polymerase I subunit RPA1